MSIILQALKKAEGNKDGEQEVKSFDQLPEPEPAAEPVEARRPPVLVIAVVFFLLVSLALVAYLIWQKNHVDTIPTSRAPTQEQQAGTVRRQAPPPVSVAPRPAAKPPAKTPSAISGAAAPLASQAPLPPTAATAPAVPAARPAPQPTPAPQTSSAGKVVTASEPLTLGPTELADRPGPAPAASPEPAAEETDSGAAELLDVPLLIEKPFEFQQAMPRISLDVHVYSDTPKRRFAIINMKKYRERDKIDTDLYLHTITPDGVVLQFRNELVKIRSQ